MDIISVNGKEWNEDFAFACEDFAFVIDGATGMFNQKISSDLSDAKWYSNNLGKYLITALNNYDKSLTEIMKDAINKLKVDFLNIAKGQEILDTPSAAIIICRIKNNIMEHFSLGDCGFLIKQNKIIKNIIKNDISILDQKNIDSMIQLSQEKHINILEAKELLNDDFIAKRKKKNKPNGYYIASDDPSACDHALTGSIKLNKNNQLLLYSDGFSQIWEVMKIYNEEEIFNKLDKKYSLKSFIEELREKQNSDPFCNNYPRTKKSDDSSAVYIKIQ